MRGRPREQLGTPLEEPRCVPGAWPSHAHAAGPGICAVRVMSLMMTPLKGIATASNTATICRAACLPICDQSIPKQIEDAKRAADTTVCAVAIAVARTD